MKAARPRSGGKVLLPQNLEIVKKHRFGGGKFNLRMMFIGELLLVLPYQSQPLD